MTAPIIYWFRNDLRCFDLPGLAQAMSSGQPVLPVYILDDTSPGEWQLGSASRWWLHHSLQSLQAELETLGSALVLRRGETREQLAALIQDTGASAVYCSRQYEPWAVQLEQDLHTECSKHDVSLRRFPGSLLFEPEAVRTGSGTPFKVFTPFWKACRKLPEPPAPKKLPSDAYWHQGQIASDKLENWSLTPTQPNWAAGWEQHWQPGSQGALAKLQQFLAGNISQYSEGRNHPALDVTTRLSPHMHFGEISPREVWHAMRPLENDPKMSGEASKFLSELGWREFSHHLLVHFPDIPESPFREPFARFPWEQNAKALESWQRGQTGYPMVDAGMRELWQTGYMHNRVRMIVASFLTKHLRIHWREGQAWFWDTLLDADLANNSCGWQWVAGSGADAAPYFRIFNPITQGEKFDADGEYIRQWVPELSALPNRYIFAPWEAPEEALEKAGVAIGTSYPIPIVEHRVAREAALDAYGTVRAGG